MACMRKELISKDDLIARLRTEVRAASSGRSRVALSVIDPDSAEPSAETAAALQRELATSRAQIDTLTAKVHCTLLYTPEILLSNWMLDSELKFVHIEILIEWVQKPGF